MLTWLLIMVINRSIIISSFYHSISLKNCMWYVSDPMLSSQSIHWYMYCSKLISCNGNPLWLLYKFEKLCKHIYFTYLHMAPPLLEKCNSIYQSTLKQVEEILYRKTYSADRLYFSVSAFISNDSLYLPQTKGTNRSEDLHKHIYPSVCVYRRQTAVMRRWCGCGSRKSFWRASFRHRNSSYTVYNSRINLWIATQPHQTRARTPSTQVSASILKRTRENWAQNDLLSVCVCQIALSSLIPAPNWAVSTESDPRAAPLQSPSTATWVMEAAGLSCRDGLVEQRVLQGVSVKYY